MWFPGGGESHYAKGRSSDFPLTLKESDIMAVYRFVFGSHATSITVHQGKPLKMTTFARAAANKASLRATLGAVIEGASSWRQLETKASLGQVYPKELSDGS